MQYYNIIKLSILLPVALSVFTGTASAQYGNDIYHSVTDIAPADSHRLFIGFGGATFIENKEYFNPYQSGYTLIGFYLRPVVEYYPGPDTRLRAGVHLLNYSGLDNFHQAIPLFTFHHRFTPGIEIVAGSLYGSLNHELIEPLFSFERVFTHHNESGLQLLIKNDFFKADAWLNWENFIFHGDPSQEEFTAGLSSGFFYGGNEGQLRVEIPLQLLATHRGGQIDASGERMQTLVNFAGGVVADWHVEGAFLRLVSFRGYLAGFRDHSNELRYPYDKGWGIYPNIYVKTRFLEGGVGYWSGNKFVAPRGEPVFQSVSRIDPDLAEDKREMLTAKLIFNRKLLRGINMAVRAGFYYDLPDGQLDHSGGLHIMIDERFFITRLKGR